MKPLFFDTDVLLDVCTERQPFYAASALVFSMCEQGQVTGFISAISFNNIYYVVRKLRGRKRAEDALTALRDVLTIVPLDARLINLALGAGFYDFEDALQYHSAVQAGAGHLLTRNVHDFPTSNLSILTPSEFIASATLL